MTIQAGNGGVVKMGLVVKTVLMAVWGQGTQGCGYNCGCLICINQCGDCPRPLGGDGGDSVWCGWWYGGNSGGINGLGSVVSRGRGSIPT